MALCSFKGARSVVRLSLSAVYHYQYSSLRDAISDLARDEAERKDVQQLFQSFCKAYWPERLAPSTIVLQTDSSSLKKPYSPTLKDRTHIPIPNMVISGNKSLSVGYEISCINLSSDQGKWSLPLSMERVGVDQTATEKALEQLEQLLNHPDLGLSETLVLNTLDSKYGNHKYLAPSWKYKNLLSVVRLRGGMKVWPEDRLSDTGGAPKIYGQKYYLLTQSRTKTLKNHPRTGQAYEVFQLSVFDHTPDDQLSCQAVLGNGRKVTIELRRWDNMMIRTKGGHNMKDKPFDLINVIVTDAQSGERVFDREMFIAISGQRKDEVTTTEGYQSYRRRYDIEPLFRFSKQRLLLESYQSPKVEHIDNWLQINMMANWLLFAASDEVEFQPHKWESYLPENKQDPDKHSRLSITKTHRAAQDLFLTFDSTPFLPPKSKKGRPRQKGETQTPRKRYPVVKKTTSKTSKKLINEKLE